MTKQRKRTTLRDDSHVLLSFYCSNYLFSSAWTLPEDNSVKMKISGLGYSGRAFKPESNKRKIIRQKEGQQLPPEEERKYEEIDFGFMGYLFPAKNLMEPPEKKKGQKNPAATPKKKASGSAKEVEKTGNDKNAKDEEGGIKKLNTMEDGEGSEDCGEDAENSEDPLEKCNYVVRGKIVETSEIENPVTTRKSVLLQLDTFAIKLPVLIPSEDIDGEPVVGNYFEGIVWLQGRAPEPLIGTSTNNGK
ncbi:MAG: DUF3881 family protein [Thermoplasmata archaeon]